MSTRPSPAPALPEVVKVSRAEWKRPSRARVRKIRDRLREMYGRPINIPHREPVDELVRTGEVRDFAEIAELGHVTRARVSQIVNLLNLAPDIQEKLLAADQAVAQLTERGVRLVAGEPSWEQQRRSWNALCPDS